MEHQEKNPKPMAKAIRRISLSENATKTIDSWRRLLQEKYPGIKISDTDLVNWCLEKQNAELSKKDLSDIEAVYFDTVKQLEWMLSQAKLAKTNKAPFTINKRPLLSGKMLDKPVSNDPSNASPARAE